ncbi:hypothetical protein GYMLUDRAFT_70792 [Collybiopsis luxurians FD-317 M1]|nr:hypothetical protein GYMLUDRAFT_70792 [Collybiopsis luxurians FD-317 M1]
MSPSIDDLRSEYEESLLSVAKSMRDAAKAAEAFAQAIGSSAPSINGHTKGKGKAVDDEPANGKRKRAKKDPNAPKRPASSFIIYQNQIRQGVKEAHPDLPTSELRKLMAEQWNNLPEEQKNHYKKMADDLKANYSAEKAAYDARSPEEVAAADAATAAAAAIKKPRKSQKPAAATDKPPIAKKPAVASASPVSGLDESDSDDDSSEDEKPAAASKSSKSGKSAPSLPSKKAAKSEPVVQESDDEEDDSEEQAEDSSEEEDQPPAKKSKSSKPHEKPASKRK